MVTTLQSTVSNGHGLPDTNFTQEFMVVIPPKKQNRLNKNKNNIKHTMYYTKYTYLQINKLPV